MRVSGTGASHRGTARGVARSEVVSRWRRAPPLRRRTRARAEWRRVSTQGTFGRGDLSVCPPIQGFTGAHERLISNWRGVPQGSPWGQRLRPFLLWGTSVPHLTAKSAERARPGGSSGSARPRSSPRSATTTATSLKAPARSAHAGGGSGGFSGFDPRGLSVLG